MVKSTKEKLDDVAARRAKAEELLIKLAEEENELGNKELLDNLNASIVAMDSLAKDQAITKEVKLAVRKLHKRLVGTSSSPSSSSSMKTSKEDKEKCVAAFLDKLTGEFTMPSLKEHAEKQGIEVSGSTEQYFRSALDGKAQVVMRNGKAKKYGVAKIWKKK